LQYDDWLQAILLLYAIGAPNNDHDDDNAELSSPPPRSTDRLLVIDALPLSTLPLLLGVNKVSTNLLPSFMAIQGHSLLLHEEEEYKGSILLSCLSATTLPPLSLPYTPIRLLLSRSGHTLRQASSSGICSNFAVMVVTMLLADITIGDPLNDALMVTIIVVGVVASNRGMKRSPNTIHQRI